MDSNGVGLTLSGVDFSYGNGLVLNNLAIDVAPGEMVALLGPNGCGKTTLLKLASGILRPQNGTACIGGRDMRAMGRKDVARRLAVLPQEFDMPFAFTVGEVVLLGRTPYIKTFGSETELDRQKSRNALDLVGVRHLERRLFPTLSGGEKQKVLLAMALAQEPKLLLLDEPTANLDIHHLVEVLELVCRLRQENGLTVVAAMHDLNLAALFFPRLIVLKAGAVCVDGPPASVVTPDIIEQIFGTRVEVEGHHVTGVPQIVIVPQSARNAKKGQDHKAAYGAH